MRCAARIAATIGQPASIRGLVNHGYHVITFGQVGLTSWRANPDRLFPARQVAFDGGAEFVDGAEHEWLGYSPHGSVRADQVADRKHSRDT